jgi:hypothetical protein
VATLEEAFFAATGSEMNPDADLDEDEERDVFG